MAFQRAPVIIKHGSLFPYILYHATVDPLEGIPTLT